MSLYLCHECYFWVSPKENRCPECDHFVDGSVPDPPLGELSRVIGNVVTRIGEVHFVRKILPENGTLYLTGNGFFFMPHVLRHRTEVVEKTSVGKSLFWMLASFAFMPLMLIMPFIKSKNLRTESVSVLRPMNLKLDEKHALAEYLMENPGAFFVARISIHSIGRRRKQWTIERRLGEQLRFSPVVNHDLVSARLEELMLEEGWRDKADV
jgi:hypothetical protein